VVHQGVVRVELDEIRLLQVFHLQRQGALQFVGERAQ
jgi:hypothetical protein